MYSLRFFCLLGLFSFSRGYKLTGSVGTIILDSVETCEDDLGDDVEVYVNLQGIDSKGTKALFSNITTKIAIDDTINYKLEVKKWDSGWKPHFAHSGKICEDTDRYAPNMWKKLKAATRPEIPDKCSLEPGYYTIDTFQAMTKDFRIPNIFYGKMRVEVVLLKDQKEVVCLIVEGISQAPF